MSERTERLATEALKGAMDASYTPGSLVEQIIVIVMSRVDDDEDDTALAVAGVPELVEPRAVLDSLLTHTAITADTLGGEVRVINLDDVGHG